jgi:hypothetical protein
MVRVPQNHCSQRLTHVQLLINIKKKGIFNMDQIKPYCLPAPASDNEKSRRTVRSHIGNFPYQRISRETEMEVVQECVPSAPKTIVTIKSTVASQRITAIEHELARLNKDLTNRRLQDSMVTTRLREEVDYAANTKKEDHIIKIGLTSKTPMPHQPEERQAWLRSIVRSIINEIVTDSSNNIVLKRQRWKNANKIPLVEVKMDSREIAQKIRKEFAAKKIRPRLWQNLFSQQFYLSHKGESRHCEGDGKKICH